METTKQATTYRAIHRGSLKTLGIGTIAELRNAIPAKNWGDAALYTSLEGPAKGFTYTDLARVSA